MHRRRQADDTRRRILDATLQVLTRGPAGASIPAVAREAGVSVPTVYRHFRTKDELFAALFPHVVYRGASSPLPLPSSLDDFRDGLTKHFGSLDGLGDAERAALVSPGGRAARRASMPGRIARTRELANALAPADSPIDRDRLTRLMVILTGTAAFNTWREDLGSSVDEAADDVVWAIRAFIAAGEREAT